ncbi:MAG: hypothetical protein JNL75_03035 [Chitinophagales bacterium]|nr:hypothetical protein [Chitinophagales bacterium]
MQLLFFDTSISIPKKRLLLLAVVVFFSIVVKSQQRYDLSSLRQKTILLRDSAFIDDQPIIPGSIYITYQGQKVDISFFELNSRSNIIISSKYFSDSILITYRVLPLRLTSLRLLGSKKHSGLNGNSVLYREDVNYTGEVESSNELEYSGSFVRGITVGSRQDAALNSGFNLNINGKLSNGLEINATMTDANIPIQPEGNSASIQEFDRIFIQLKKDSHKIILGDFDISNESYYRMMRFDRKLQGIRYQTSFPIGAKSTLQLGASAALTRGTFSRNVFQAEENNQGPYKLIGNNGETFIIIIAGTEKVFINGQLMKRGVEHDYVINYNVGEVVFTPNRLITKDLRIVIEFQYSDRSFFRYSLEANARLVHPKYEIYSQMFTENDDKNKSLIFGESRSKEMAQRLSSIGNKLDSAFINAETEIVWDPSRVSYLKSDTTAMGITYTIYKWAETKQENVYQVLFTQVGLNRGNYILKSTAANGSVYQWVAPINGVLQGNYEPSLRITTPKTHLQWTSGGVYKWNNQQITRAEISYTSNDLNTFSEIQDNENKGIGMLINHKATYVIDSHKSLNLEVEQEYTSTHFSPLTRYRNNEFQRDWGLNLPIRNEVEQSLTTLSIGYSSRTVKSRLGGNLFYIPNSLNGLQSFADLQWSPGNWLFYTNQNLVSSGRSDTSTIFYRPKAGIRYFLLPQRSSIEVGFFHEINRTKIGENTLQRNGFLWQNYFLNWNNKFNQANSLNFNYIYRTEQINDSLQFLPPNIRAHTFSLDGQHEFSNSQTLKYILKYRNFSSIVQTQEIQHNYMGRIDYNSHYANGFVRLNTTYEVKAGREQRIQLTYVKAPNGFGNYAWRDLNNNGVFELNEAYVSPIVTENNFMRFFVALPDFIPANEVNYSQQITLTPKAKWHNQKDWRKWAAKLSYHLRFDVNKKVRTSDETGFLDYANPLAGFKDSLLIFSRSHMFQQISFQKNEGKIGLDLEWLYNNSSNLLSNGIEGFSLQNYALRSRVELAYFLTYFGKLSNGIRRNTSEFFLERNFQIIENGIENTFSFYLHRNVKLNLNANYGFKSTGIQYSILHQGDIEFKLARKNDGIIETRFTLLNQSYEAQILNPQIELSMLNGIPRGLNYIWNLTVGQKLTKYLQLNLIYNGRKNENSPQLIHSGNVEARAIF